MEYYTTSIASISTDLRTITEAFKAHEARWVYKVPPYLLDDRVNISTTINLEDFRVNQFISRGLKSEIYSANMYFCPPVVIKKASIESVVAESEILNEIQLLKKIQHRNIIGIMGARIAKVDPFIGTLHMRLYHLYMHDLSYSIWNFASSIVRG